MFNMKLSRTIDVGQIATALAVIIGAGALYYQAVAARVAERDLNVKVIQVRALADSLAAERKQRDEEYVDALRRSSKILDLNTNNFANLRLRDANYFGTLALICNGLSVTSDGTRAHVLTASNELATALAEMITIEEADAMSRIEAFRRSDKAFDAIARSPIDSEDGGSRRDAIVMALTRDMERLNTGLEQALASPSARYRRAKTRLLAALKEK